MYIKTAYSTKGTSDDVIQDLKSQLGGFDTKMLVFFASSRFAPNIISQKVQDAFPGAAVFGCTTSGEIVTGKMLKNSLVAMAFDATAVNDVKVEIVENPKNENSVRKAFAGFESYFKAPMSELDPSKYVGLIFVDGLSGSEEKLIDKIGDLTNVTFIGGSAGDDLKFVFICSSTAVICDEAESVTATPLTHDKCERCWHVREDVGANAEHPGLCGRCVSNLHGAGEVRRFA